MQSILVSVSCETVAERYFRDRRPEDLSNVHSVTKSVLATLVGMAVDDGALALEAPIAEFIGEVTSLRSDPVKRRIRIEHLLTMTSGLDPDTPNDIDEIGDRGESWLEGPLAAPPISEPGSEFAYNNGAAHVLGICLSRAVGVPLAEFASERLFRPMGIDRFRWPADPDGNPLGYGHLELRPRDLLKLGELYLRQGQANGEQLLSADFVRSATMVQSAGGAPEGVGYGYLWWVTEDEGHSSFFAGGFGGQYATVVPELELVVVSTGDAACFIDTSRNLRRLVGEVVVPWVARLRYTL